MPNTFYCGLCKLQKNIGEVKGIILLENIIDMSNGKICNLCFYRLHTIFKTTHLDDKQQQLLTDWKMISK